MKYPRTSFFAFAALATVLASRVATASAFAASTTSAAAADAELPAHTRVVQVVDFTAGQSETWIEPPAGDYQLRVALLNNVDGWVMAEVPASIVRVESGRAGARTTSESTAKVASI